MYTLFLLISLSMTQPPEKVDSNQEKPKATKKTDNKEKAPQLDESLREFQWLIGEWVPKTTLWARNEYQASLKKLTTDVPAGGKAMAVAYDVEFCVAWLFTTTSLVKGELSHDAASESYVLRFAVTADEKSQEKGEGQFTLKAAGENRWSGDVTYNWWVRTRLARGEPKDYFRRVSSRVTLRRDNDDTFTLEFKEKIGELVLPGATDPLSVTLRRVKPKEKSDK